MIKLQELRQEKSISQAELAKALGLTQQSYSRYERGVCELSYNALIKIARYFDVSVDYLLGNSTYYYPDSLQTAMPTLSEEENRLLKNFRSMRDDLRAYFLEMSETFTQSPENLIQQERQKGVKKIEKR